MNATSWLTVNYEEHQAAGQGQMDGITEMLITVLPQKDYSDSVNPKITKVICFTIT